MNKDKLRDLCLNLSKKSGLSFNVVQTQYFLESILKRISMSHENKNFIFMKMSMAVIGLLFFVNWRIYDK